MPPSTSSHRLDASRTRVSARLLNRVRVSLVCICWAALCSAPGLQAQTVTAQATGADTIRVASYDGRNGDSNGHRLHAIVISIADADTSTSKQIAGALLRHGSYLFDSTYVRHISRASHTQPVEDALAHLSSETGPDDTVVLYVQGHTRIKTDSTGRSFRLFFHPPEIADSTSRAGGPRSLSARTIKRYLDDIPATNQLLVIDGEVPDVRLLPSILLVPVEAPWKNRVVIQAGTAATDSSRSGQRIFPQAFLSAVRGSARRADADDAVAYVRDLERYLHLHTHLVQQRVLAEQTGYSALDVSSFGRDFPIGAYTRNHQGLIITPVRPQAAPDTTSSRISLERHAPTAGRQLDGTGGIGWALAHAVTMVEAIRDGVEGDDVDSLMLSPAFIEHHLQHPGDCRSQSRILDGLLVLERHGAPRMHVFPATAEPCGQSISDSVRTTALQHTLRTHQPVPPTVAEIRDRIRRKQPVVAGIDVYPSFHHLSGPDWYGRGDDIAPIGQQAVVITGFDDSHLGGSLQIMNSRGTNWGDRGFAWVRYNDVPTLVREAFVLIP